MEKTFATDDHSQLIEAAGGRAFQFFERKDRMTKSASDVISRSDIADHMPPDGSFGVHLITMGAEEMFGPNRNGDSASINALSKYHGTFEKFGCVYREHRNRDPRTQGVGSVRLARYNPAMHRGELVVWVEKDKAPDMYKAASNDEELSWSMSMRLPHDECSCCHKKSRTTAQYCDHLSRNMLRYVPGFEKFAYARNEEGIKFFDISEVERRADRIATFLRYTFPGSSMSKAASDGKVITGTEWAEYYLGPQRVVPFTPWEDLTLEKLAAAEEFVRREGRSLTFLETMAKMAPQDLTQEQIETLASQDFRNASGELAKRAMLINFGTFASLVTGKTIDELQKDASFVDVLGTKIPNLLSDLFQAGGCACGEDVAESVTPDECGCSFSPGKDSIDRLMTEVGGDLGMGKEESGDRALRVTIVKSAKLVEPSIVTPVDPFYNGLAQAYGRYVVKAAHQIKDHPEVSETALFRSIAASLMIHLS